MCHRQNTSSGRILFSTFYCLPLSSLRTTHRHWIHMFVYYLVEVFSMLLVLSITSNFHYNIWGCMCSTGPFQCMWLKGYIYSSCYYHHQIGSISPFALLSYFAVVLCLRCLLHHILVLIAYTFRENQDFLGIIVQFIDGCFGLQIVFVCLYITPSHYHHCANLSDDIEIIKCLSDIFCRMCG